MQAIFQEGYGVPKDLKLREMPVPSISATQVLVRVHASSLHPDVWHMVTGRPAALRLFGAGLLRPKQPIPGTDMAGVITAIGADVVEFTVGDAVFGEVVSANQWTNGGTFAEYIAVEARYLVKKPPAVSFQEAAVIPTAGLIALNNLISSGKWEAGARVLVNGAAGGVGSLAMQMAQAKGCDVDAFEKSSRLALLKELGAKNIFDAEKINFCKEKERYDLIFDIPGNYAFKECCRALKADGIYIFIGHDGFGLRGGKLLGFLPYFFSLGILSHINHHLPKFSLRTIRKKTGMDKLRGYLEQGQIFQKIGAVYPLEEISTAMTQMMQGDVSGRIVLQIADKQST